LGCFTVVGRPNSEDSWSLLHTLPAVFLGRQPPPHILVGLICDNLAQNATTALFSAHVLTFTWPTQPSHPSASLLRRSRCLWTRDLMLTLDFFRLHGQVLSRLHLSSV